MRRAWWRLKWWLGRKALRASEDEIRDHLVHVARRQEELARRSARLRVVMLRLAKEAMNVRRETHD